MGSSLSHLTGKQDLLTHPVSHQGLKPDHQLNYWERSSMSRWGLTLGMWKLWDVMSMVVYYRCFINFHIREVFWARCPSENESHCNGSTWNWNGRQTCQIRKRVWVDNEISYSEKLRRYNVRLLMQTDRADLFHNLDWVFTDEKWKIKCMELN